MLLKFHTTARVYINRLRTMYYRSLFKSFGQRSRVVGRLVVYHPNNISLGGNSVLNEGVLLNARAPITIGSLVHISPYCIVNAGGLDYSQTMERRAHFAKPINIEDGVWIGSGAIINPGVTIGMNSVIAAGAVVTRDVPADSIAAGGPAEGIKKN